MNIQKLSQASSRTLIRAQVEECVKFIDSLIETTHASGNNIINYSLPTNFVFDGYTLADAQLIVYSDLVAKYKTPIESGGKGFSETYYYSSPPRLVIRWKIGLTKSEREDRIAILGSAAPPPTQKNNN
jgi:hypothetical protein